MTTVFIILIFMSYITLGLPDSAAGTAWPYMRIDLDMPLAAAGIYSAVVMVCSAISAAAVPHIAKKVDTGVLLAICSLVTGACILGVSFCGSFYAIVAIGVPLGLAGGGVDVSINNYVSERYSSRIMNWVHASWGFGAMVGPLLITLALNSAGSWRTGFQILAGVQLAFALILFLFIPLWKKNPVKIRVEEQTSAASASVKRRSLAIFLAVLTFFLYGGVETSVGNWLNSLLVESRGLDVTKSGACVSVFYGAIMAGRLGFGFLSNKIGNRNAIRAGIALAAVGACVFFVKNAAATYVAVALIGIGFAPVYPCLMHETVRRFVPQTAKKVVGYQVCFACFGMISVSPLVGVIMQNVGLESLTVAVLVLLALLALAVVALDALTPNKKKPDAMLV